MDKNLTSNKRSIKTYEFNVAGFPTVTKTGRSRGKLLAGVFFDYQGGYDNSCTFKEFLKICSVVRVTSPWQKKVWVSGEEAMQVGPEEGSCIPVMHDWNETPVWSHILDVSNEGPRL